MKRITAETDRDTTETRMARVKKRYPDAVCERGGPRKYRASSGEIKQGHWFYIYDRVNARGMTLGLGGSPRGAWGNVNVGSEA